MIQKLFSIKTIIFSFLLFLGLSYFILNAIIQKIEDLKTDRYQEVSNLMNSELKTLINEKQETLLNIAISISDNDKIKQALLSHNPTNIDLTPLSSKLKTIGSLQNAWFQIIKNDGISFYRSWTKKRGDNLKNVRLDVTEMIKNPQVKSSISVGIFDLTFKSMVPIYDKDKFIGIFESIAKFNSISTKMSQKGYKTVIVVDKKYREQLKKPFSPIFIDDYYIVNTDADKKSLDFIKNKTVEYFLSINEQFTIDKNSNNFTSIYKIYNINKEPVAYFLTFKKLNTIKTSDIEQMRNYLLSLFIIVVFILIAIIYYIYTSKYKVFLEKMTTKLEEKVAEKTQTLNHLAHHDSLTGLPNRILFLDRLEHAIKHAKRMKQKVAILFLDLDRFKEVNDTLGHEAGDMLLRQVSKKLKKCVREEDTVSRFGGDEFTMLIENIGTAQLISVTEKIISIMQDPILIMNNNLHATFSIGISVYPNDGNHSDILLRNADTAMYKAKDKGKNTYQLYNASMTDEMIQRINLENNIREAIKNKDFSSYFQPQVNALTNQVTGAEALIRWNHKELGFIQPDKFINLAEEVGLIIEIGKWMIFNSIDIFMRLQSTGLSMGKLSLNISVKQLEYKNFVADIKQILEKTNFDPQYLEFEITESQIMKDPQRTINVLHSIKRLGISIAIDDFGTGYSSLSYLKKLPIDKLKIDKSFINYIPTNEEDIAIVKSIIGLAKNLNLELIAEGVETPEQKDFLLSIGCDNIQGYLYSRAIPEEEYKTFLQQF